MLPDSEGLTLLDTGFEGYPPEYVTHNTPFIVLSGLEADEKLDIAQVPPRYRDGALRIRCDLPPVMGPLAADVLEAFHSFERKDGQWDSKPVVEGSNVMGFRFRVTGRV
jgi:hypothetical protein